MLSIQSWFSRPHTPTAFDRLWRCRCLTSQSALHYYEASTINAAVKLKVICKWLNYKVSHHSHEWDVSLSVLSGGEFLHFNQECNYQAYSNVVQALNLQTATFLNNFTAALKLLSDLILKHSLVPRTDTECISFQQIWVETNSQLPIMILMDTEEEEESTHCESPLSHWLWVWWCCINDAHAVTRWVQTRKHSNTLVIFMQTGYST